MIDIENENLNQTDVMINSLGERLKKAREAMSLTIKEAAAHLHLSSKIIDMIENEQFSKGPPATFMRGYIRSYARLLNVSDYEIHHTLKELDIVAPIKSTSLPILQTRSMERSNRYLHWITYLIVITLIILVGLWWHSHQRYIITDVPTKAAPSTVTTSAPVTAAPSTSTSTTVLPTTNPVSPSSESLNHSAENSSPVAEAPVETPVEAATVTPAPTANTSVTTVETTTAPATNAPTAAVTPPTTTPAPTTNPVPPLKIAIPPQVDMPPIISDISAPSMPGELNATETPPTTPAKSQHKNKQNSRHGTLPGIPGVHMALPEPN
jgi:cytoskeleton protein RodZ